jgi:hypothetical protein
MDHSEVVGAAGRGDREHQLGCEHELGCEHHVGTGHRLSRRARPSPVMLLPRWTLRSCDLVEPASDPPDRPPLRGLPGLRPADHVAICTTCAGFGPSYACSRCGQEGKLHGRRLCTRCALTAGLAELLDDDTGRIRPELAPLADLLASMDNPLSGLTWLYSRTRPTRLAGGSPARVGLRGDRADPRGVPSSAAVAGRRPSARTARAVRCPTCGGQAAALVRAVADRIPLPSRRPHKVTPAAESLGIHDSWITSPCQSGRPAGLARLSATGPPRRRGLINRVREYLAGSAAGFGRRQAR